MKPHLPQKLLTALIAAMCTALPQTLAGDSISINFYSDGKTIGSTTAGTTLFGVDVTDWNDVTATDGVNTQNLTVTTANEQDVSLNLTTPQAAYGPGANTSTLEDKLQASYLDVTTWGRWSLTLDTGDMWLKDVTFYMAGDGGSGTYDAITVNGVDYIGGVNQKGSDAWGTRKKNDGSLSYSTVAGYDGSTAIADGDLNSNLAVRVTGVAGTLTAGNNANDTGRGTLAGIQVVDVTDSKVYTSTLGSDAALGEIAWSKQGVEGTSTLGSIAEAERYLSVTAAEAGSTLSVTEATSIAGLQLVANNLTVTGSALTVGALHANSGTTLTMEAALAGSDLLLTGLGTISLKDMAYTGAVTVDRVSTVQLQAGTQSVGSFVNNGTVQLAAGVVPGYQITNHGTVSLQTTDGILNSLVDAEAGAYKSSVISNSSTGNILIETSGNKTLSGDLTLTNGGKVTLKGGTFGTAESAITQAITSGSTATILAFENTTAYLGSGTHNVNVDIEVGNGAVLHFTEGDTLDWGTSRVLSVLTGGEVDLGTNRQSLASTYEVHMKGGTIKGAGAEQSSYILGLDFYGGGTIKTMENSTIATNIGGHNTGTLYLDVNNGKTLTITGNLTGGGSFEKREAGTVSYQGAAFSNNLVISGGVFEYSMSEDGELANNISGAGIFKKNGTGTLTINGTNITSGLLAGEGKIVFNVADNAENEVDHSISSLGVTQGAAFEKTGAGTLSAGALESGTFGGDIVVSEGVLQFTGDNEEKGGNPPKFVQLLQSVTTTATSKVRVTGNVVFNWQEKLRQDNDTVGGTPRSFDINDNVEVTGSLQINTWNTGYDADGDPMTSWKVVEGGTLTVGDKLWLTNRQKLVLEGGTVVANGGIVLGHNANADSYYSKFVQKSGSVTASALSFVGSGNTVLVNGGTLTFNPVTDGGNVLLDGKTSESAAGAGTVTINGGTLVAADKSWAMTATDKIAVSLGNVEFDIAAEKTVTLGGPLTITGGLTNAGAGTLAFASGTTLAMSSAVLSRLDVCSSTVAANANGLAENFSYVLVAGNASGSASVTLDGSTSLTLTDGKIATTDSAFIVGSTFSTEDATTENGAVTAGRFHVNSGGVFTIAGDIAGVPKEEGSEEIVGGHTVASMLTTTTGTGTMVLSKTGGTQITTSTVFAGDLKVGSGVTVTVGNGHDNTAEISSLNSLILNGGDVIWNAKGSNVQNLSVTEDSSWTIFDMASGSTLTMETVNVEQGKTLTVNKVGSASWKQSLNIAALAGAGNAIINGPGSSDWGEANASSLLIGSLGGFTGDLTITSREGDIAAADIYHATVNTGVAGATLGNLTFTGFGETGETSTATFNVQGNTSIDTLNIAGGTVNLSEGVTLSLGQTGEGAQASTSTIGSLTTGENAGISLGNNATLKLEEVQPDGYMGKDTGNTNANASLELAITGGTGSILDIKLGGQTGWAYNNTVKLSALTEGGNTVESVYIREGALANAVFSGVATTDLGGAALKMADGTTLTLRKVLNDNQNFGAGDISLEGTTELYLYDAAFTLSNNISGKKLSVTNAGSITFTGNMTLEEFSSTRDVTLGQAGDGGLKTTYTLGSVAASKLTLNQNATMNAFTKTGSGTLTLAGSGIYNLGVAHTMTSGVVLDSTWSGQVVVNNVKTNADIRFDKLGVAGSTVVVGQDGIQGYLQKNPNADNGGGVAKVTYAANIQLDGDLTITNGYTDGDYIFNGAISGEGDWLITRTAGGTNSYKFAGNISGWQGELKQTGSQTTNVTLGSGVTTVNAAITREDGTLNLTVEDNASFNKAIAVSDLTLRNGKTLTFNAGGTVSGAVTAGGTIHVEDGTLSIGGNLSASGQTLELSGADNTEGKSTAKIRLEGTDNQVKKLDFGKNGYARGVLELGAGTKTTVSGADGGLWMNNGVSILLESDATLTVASCSVTGTGNNSSITIDTSKTSTTDNYKGQFTGQNTVKYILSNVDVNTTLGSFTYTLTNSALTNTGTNELTVSNGNNTITTLTADKGNVKVSESMSVQSIAAKSEKVVTVENGKTVTMAGGVKLSTNGADATLKGRTDNAMAQLQSDTTFSISDMALSNAVITTTVATPVVLQNVTAENTMLAGGKFTLNATPTVGTYDTESSTGTMSYSIGLGVQTGASLTLNLDVLNAVGAEQHGVYDITITLSGFGADFSIDTVEAIRGMVDFEPESWLAKSLASQGAVYGLSSGNVEDTPVAQGSVPTVTYSAVTGENVGSLVISINGLNIPEPTTATLSLLALAGLAMRRRRK